jgi:exopolyphosphatase/pppGpp-phosphohydrolase
MRVAKRVRASHPSLNAWQAYARDAVVIGTSGTIESVQSVLVANGFDSGPVTREGVAELERAILERRWISDLSVPGLEPERVDIFPAGLAAVSAIFDALDIDRLEFVDASLQHGLLYDLTARRTRERQARTVAGWQHHVASIRRVASTHWCFDSSMRCLFMGPGVANGVSCRVGDVCTRSD